jgi:branched-subunit amino acid transport protein
MTAWLAVALAGLGSFGLRFGVVSIIDRFTLPPSFERVSALVMPAAFAGLAAVALATPITSAVPAALPVIGAAAVTIAIARVRSAAWAVGSGMSALWLAELGVAVVTS